MLDRALVRVLAGLLLACFARPADLIGQTKKVLVRGMAIDGKEMSDSLSIPYWRALASAPCPQVAWAPSYASAQSFAASISPLRHRLRRSAGRIVPDPNGAVISRRTVFDGPRYTIESIVVGSRVPNGTSIG